MNLSEYIEKKQDLLDGEPDDFLKAANKAQKQIFQDILEEVSRLETNKDGSIKATKANLLKIDSITEKINKAFKGSEYAEAVKSFAKSFGDIKKINESYFEKNFGKSTRADFADAVLTLQRQRAVDALVQTSPQRFVEGIKPILDNAVATGAGWRETVSEIKNYTLGNEDIDGRLTKYAKQITTDAYNTADALYTLEMSKGLGLEFYRYVGGKVKDTRDFCLARNGKYFHFKEVQGWGNLKDWSGRNPNTNENTIFVLRGGYNCRHSLVPISTFAVPKIDLQRAIEKGYFRPSEKEKELLNL